METRIQLLHITYILTYMGYYFSLFSRRHYKSETFYITSKFSAFTTASNVVRGQKIHENKSTNWASSETTTRPTLKSGACYWWCKCSSHLTRGTLKASAAAASSDLRGKWLTASSDLRGQWLHKQCLWGRRLQSKRLSWVPATRSWTCWQGRNYHM